MSIVLLQALQLIRKKKKMGFFFSFFQMNLKFLSRFRGYLVLAILKYIYNKSIL